jgi:hypothetical protein
MVAPTVAKASAKAEEAAKPDPSWTRYVGTYAWEDDVAQVMLLDGELCIVDPSDEDPWENRIRLEPVEPDTFRMKTGYQEGELIQFTIDGNGNVIRMSEPGDYMLRQP